MFIGMSTEMFIGIKDIQFNSVFRPSLQSLDPREGVNKTLTPGLQCTIPTAPRPVISEHVEQQTITSPPKCPALPP